MVRMRDYGSLYVKVKRRKDLQPGALLQVFLRLQQIKRY
ncbi:hypothetical protein C2W64_04136 [Brevibacillus laterosporus]|nr:hypothetical protein C2W64_04136 [Brevibacillus laterosporus]